MNLSITAEQLWENKALFHSLRYLLIMLIALIISHLFSINQLPFTPGYSFPVTPFLVITICGAIICTANWWVYGWVKLPEVQDDWRRISNRLILTLGSTFVFYTVTYLITFLGWFGTDFVPVHYLKFLLMVSSIMVLEFLFVELLRMRLEPSSTPAKQVYIATMTQDVRLAVEEIDMIHSENGIVTLYSNTHKPLITRYSSLDEISKSLPEDIFFRINRQALVNRKIVSSIKRNDNRTLNVQVDLNGHTPNQPLQVSRYKRSAFLAWLKAHDLSPQA